jgi:hypothetical protein
MNKIKEIILSYATAINPTEEQKQAAEERIKICMKCEFWQEAAISYCSKCGCPTAGKIFSPIGLQACPELKWTV